MRCFKLFATPAIRKPVHRLSYHAFAMCTLWLGTVGTASAIEVFDNGKLRFGTGAENSVNANGNLQQPFYRDATLNQWFKLTFSNYPLDNAIGIDGDGTNEWNTNGTIVLNSPLSGQVIDTSAYISTGGNTGYGTIISTGTATIAGKTIEVKNTYTLAADKSFIRIVTTLKNTAASNLTNVRLWVGTRDDYVGTTDDPDKLKGNIVNGAFAAIVNPADRAAALQISSSNTGVLFYSTSPKANTAINSCCSFSSAYNQDPATSVIQDIQTDGSYALFVRMNDLAPGASEDFVWYYAAGELASLTAIVGDVAQAVNNFNVTATAGQGGVISPANTSVAAGATTAFTVTPNSGYVIDTVQGCGGSLNDTTYTTGAISNACTVTATFRLITYTVTANAGAGGSISPPSSIVNHGSTTTLTVTPNSGFSVSNVQGCGGTLTGNSFTTGAITGNCSVAASFVANQYAVTTASSAGGSVNPASAVVQSGNSTSFTVAPEAGFSIASITGCGGTLSGSTYTTAAISGVCTISVEFTLTRPVFTPAQPATLDLLATGLTTELPANVAPEAVDYLGRKLNVTLTDSPTRFAPGVYTLKWSAVDERGVSSIVQQTLRVRPLVSVGKDITLGFQQGNASQFRVALNGRSPDYPLTVNYTVSGSLSGHSLASGSVVFANGETEKDIPFSISSTPAAGTPNQQVIVQLADDLNLDQRSRLTVTLVTANVAPVARPTAQQNGEQNFAFSRAQGTIVLDANVQDTNSADTHTVQWFAPTGANVTNSGTQLALQPSSLPVGVHRFEVSVMDNGSPALSTRGTLDLVLLDSVPALPDGVQRLAANGLPDDPAYSPPTPNVLPEFSRELNQFLVEGDPGVQMRLGPYALFFGKAQAQVAPDSSLIGDDTISNIGGYFDFVVRDLAEAGQSVNVVLPQHAPVPANAVYRKFDSQNKRWNDFVLNDTNRLASAPGQQGYCPPPNSTAYRAGLNAGDWCVRLTISDGGPNDDDAQANGAVSDPGGVAALASVTISTRGSGNTSGGGGAMGPALLLFGVGLLALRVRRVFGAAHGRAGALLMLCMMVTAAAFAQDTGLYLGAQIGLASGERTENDLNSALSAGGYNVVADYDDRRRTAWNAFVGYQLTRHVGLQAGYANLGDVGATLSGAVNDVDSLLSDVERLQPLSAAGAELVATGRYPFTSQLAVSGKAGILRWNSRYNIAGINDSSTERVTSSGTDLSLGLALQYSVIENWWITADWTRYRVDTETIQFAGLGVGYRF